MIIDIYGLVIECIFDSEELAKQLIRPFAYFKKEETRQFSVKIVVKEENPPYESLPSLEARFSSPRNLVYKDKELKIIDYFGKGIVIENRKKSFYQVYSRDSNLLQEVFYLLIISLFGEYCDKKWMLRIHALGVSYHNKAILLVSTAGTGKSAMAIALLQEEGIKLISDDEPIFHKQRGTLPFPLRIGIPDNNTVTYIPPEYIYKIDRMEFGTKYFVDCGFWKDRIETRALKEIVLLFSVRKLKGKPYIEKITKTKAFGALFRDAVIGIGLYQGMEFIFSNSVREVFLKIPIIFRRLILAIKLNRLSKTYRFVLSNDIGQNVCLFKDFIQKINNR